MDKMYSDVEKVLYSQQEIAQRVAQIGEQITRDYEGKELLLVGILKGAVVFFADLMRSIDLPLTTDFMALTSYGASSTTSGVVRILKDLDKPCKDKHVLIVEDIVDTGLTLKYLTDTLKVREPASIKVCCLLDKPSRRKVEMKADYVGFNVPDVFVIGYGLDLAEKYRNLPDVCAPKPHLYE